MWTRRTFFKSGLACGVLAVAGTKVRLAHAALPDDKRFVVVILRGGLDGLAAVPAHGDPDYASLRGTLALPKTGAGAPIDLDGFFGLNPAFHNLAEMWQKKELVLFHNISTPYRERSHFDAQNVLETGAAKPHLVNDGWLNRALQPLGLDSGNGALAVSASPPLLLDGPARVTSWMPSRMPPADEEFLARVGQLYAKDKVLSVALQQALATRATVMAAMHDDAPPDPLAMGAPQRPSGNGQTGAAGYGAIAPLMKGAGEILAASGGPRVAVFDVSGWDTHSNQGAGDGQLARRLQALDEGFAALKTALGPAWQKTAVVAASEFGRTVAANGTGGTDHGTAGVAFLMGGTVAGRTIHAEWVGLKAAALRDARDLPARTDTRSLFKAALSDHLGVARSALETRVFPESGAASPLKTLFRA
jgi:uncharacterized protein (DUF1501 family)